MITKVVVSAAGRGTRMLHLSKESPKYLIEINNKPFLYYLLNNLQQAGFKEIIMIVGYQKELMENFLKNYKSEFKITIINQFDALGDKYGTACPIECVKDNIKNDESFVSVCGDNLYSTKDLKKFLIDDEFNYVSGIQHSEPHRYGVLVKDDADYLKEIIEKPDPKELTEKNIGNLINTGLYKFTPSIFKKIPLINKSPRGEYEMTDVINLLAEEKKVKIKEIEDYWLDLGRPEDIPKLTEFIKNNT